jgi:hypothetical protein
MENQTGKIAELNAFSSSGTVASLLRREKEIGQLSSIMYALTTGVFLYFWELVTPDALEISDHENTLQIEACLECPSCQKV